VAEWDLAQLNVARLRAPLGDPSVREFVEALDRINALAERSPGYVWRMTAPSGHVSSYDGDERTIANLSVWTSYEHLHAFTFRSAHGGFVRRRSTWFERGEVPVTVLWWLPVGETPTLDQGLGRLAHLRRHGPAPQAFSLRRRFDATGRPVPRRRVTT